MTEKPEDLSELQAAAVRELESFIHPNITYKLGPPPRKPKKRESGPVKPKVAVQRKSNRHRVTPQTPAPAPTPPAQIPAPPTVKPKRVRQRVVDAVLTDRGLTITAKNSEKSVNECRAMAQAEGGATVLLPVKYVYKEQGGMAAIKAAMVNDPDLDPNGYLPVQVLGSADGKKTVTQNREAHKIAQIAKGIRVREMLKSPEAEKEIKVRLNQIMEAHETQLEIADMVKELRISERSARARIRKIKDQFIREKLGKW